MLRKHQQKGQEQYLNNWNTASIISFLLSDLIKFILDCVPKIYRFYYIKLNQTKRVFTIYKNRKKKKIAYLVFQPYVLGLDLLYHLFGKYNLQRPVVEHPKFLNYIRPIVWLVHLWLQLNLKLLKRWILASIIIQMNL